MRTGLRAYRLQLEELLLAALAQTLVVAAEGAGGASLRGPKGSSAVAIDLEGHGREPLFDDVELSRTVGWFTTMYPVVVDLPVDAPPRVALEAAKTALRSVPQRGIGFGLLRYLAPGEVGSHLAELPPRDVSFNYLGQASLPQSADGWSFAPEDPGEPSAAANRRGHLIDVTAIVIDGRLEQTWRFDARAIEPSLAEGLASGCASRVRALAEHCLASEREAVAPVDFPLASGISEESLAWLGELAEQDEP
jgi:microcystin synthetase protein McyA